MRNSTQRLAMVADHLSPVMSSSPSLCFSSASEQYHEGKISWEEYIRHCLLHFVKGFPLHDEDKLAGARYENINLRVNDPFAYALWCWQDRKLGVKDVSELEAIFHTYAHGSADDLPAFLNRLSMRLAFTMRRALAHLALKDRKLDVLKYVLNDGQREYEAPFATAFLDQAMAVDRAREPELYDIIQQSRWMDLRRQYLRKISGSGFDDLW